MSGQVAQLDQGPYRGGSPASKVGAKAKAPGGPLICKKKKTVPSHARLELACQKKKIIDGVQKKSILYKIV